MPQNGASPGAPSSNAQALQDIDAALAALETKSREYEANGAAAEPLEKSLKALRAVRPALEKPGVKAPALKTFLAAVNKALAAVKADTDRQENAEGAGDDKAITALHDIAADLIKAITGDAKKPLDVRLAKLASLIQSVGAATDPAKQAGLRKQADTDAQALIDAAGEASGAAGKQKIQDAYKKALTEKYGITLGGKGGKNVNDDMHYDLLFKAFEMVPVGQSMQATMKDLSYAPRLDKKSKSGEGIGLFTGNGIEIGKIGALSESEYVNPKTGKPEKVNSFSITVLHELGHSVDTRWGIMQKYKSQKGAGSWSTIKVGTLATQVATGHAAAMKGLMDDDAVHAAVLNLMTTHDMGDAPEGVTPDAWKKLTHLLANWTKLLKAKYAFTAQVYYNDLGYIPHGSGVWETYSATERKSLGVTGYQWNASPEWFAELYATCWYNKTPPSDAIHAGVRAYLPQKGGAASAGAPA